MAEGRFYVIGDKGSGVLFVKTNPFRAALVTDQVIQAYDAAHPGVDGYARIAAAAWTMIAEQDLNPGTGGNPITAEGIEDMVASGVTLCQADFALAADIDDTGWDMNRMITMPIEQALTIVGPNGSQLPGGPPDGTLREAVLSDTPSQP
jgi:hypothetical protein